MHPFGRWSHAPRPGSPKWHRPGSRQPEQYAPDVWRHPNLRPRKPAAFLLRSKVAAGMAAPTTAYRMWKRLASQPGGSRLFSAAEMVRVPYFASIAPHVVRMEAGHRRGRAAQMVFVYNHLHPVHAIASCNAAEIAMGMLMEATVPTSHRWIPKAMTVQYLE
jgi:hypothetical protein